MLELLGHVNKRLKASKAMALPLLPLARLATGAGAPAVAGAPMVRSFGLVYTEMAVERAGPGDLLAAVRGRRGAERCVCGGSGASETS